MSRFRTIKINKGKISKMIKNRAGRRAIAIEIGCSQVIVPRILADHGLRLLPTFNSAENVDRIRMLSGQGLGYGAIATELGCRTNTVQKLCGRHGIRPQRTPRKGVDIELIRQLIQSRTRVVVIAEKLGVSTACIYDRCRQNDLTPNIKTIFPRPDLANLRWLRESKSVREMASHFSVSAHTVYRWLRYYGLPNPEKRPVLAKTTRKPKTPAAKVRKSRKPAACSNIVPVPISTNVVRLSCSPKAIQKFDQRPVGQQLRMAGGR
ncbi:MAG: hypothetical protein COA84_15200 [Robiginitomaculum sp.]|nr:MAG: hypothetical protein COA84_15200 [Robiginitomaculum sp.]